MRKLSYTTSVGHTRFYSELRRMGTSIKYLLVVIDYFCVLLGMTVFHSPVLAACVIQKVPSLNWWIYQHVERELEYKHLLLPLLLMYSTIRGISNRLESSLHRNSPVRSPPILACGWSDKCAMNVPGNFNWLSNESKHFWNVRLHAFWASEGEGHRPIAPRAFLVALSPRHLL